jgi:hypothetical protein
MPASSVTVGLALGEDDGAIVGVGVGSLVAVGTAATGVMVGVAVAVSTLGTGDEVDGV